MSKIVAFSGRLRVGKDYLAKAINGRIIGFADPLYEIGAQLLGLGVDQKDAGVGLREFYQKVGQWGRGSFSEHYPASTERALFTMNMRMYGAQLLPGWPVNWDSFGLDENIWTNTLIQRTQDLAATGNEPVCVTNARFKNELSGVVEAGAEHYHVVCSDQTYLERLRIARMDPGSKELKDVSEFMAQEMDREVKRICRIHPTGPKLMVVWNDHRPLPPDGGRLLTFEEFKERIEHNEQQRIEPDHQPEPEPVARPAVITRPDTSLTVEQLERAVEDIGELGGEIPADVGESLPTEEYDPTPEPTQKPAGAVTTVRRRSRPLA